MPFIQDYPFSSLGSGNLEDSVKSIAATSLLKYVGDQTFSKSLTLTQPVQVSGDLTLEVF